MHSNEEWRDVVGFEGSYQVSNLGRVRSVDRIVRGRSNCTRHIKGKVLRPADNSSGYLICGLTRHNEQSMHPVHRLVAHAFLGPRPKGFEVNHKDGHKPNNVDTNLEYVSRSDNLKHAFRLGLNSTRGERNGRSKLSGKDVADIRRLYNSGRYTFSQLAKVYGVATSTISHAYRGRNWG